MTTRRFILFCLLAIPTLTLGAQDNPVRDSLASVLETLPHDTSRLKMLLSLVKNTQDNPEQSKHYNQLLLLEAERQQNDSYRCEAYLTDIVAAYNNYDTRGVEEALQRLEPIARKEKRYDLLFKGWRCQLDCMILSQDYEHVERKAREMLILAEALNSTDGLLETYQSLANLYRLTFRQEQALELLEKAAMIAIPTGNNATILNICQTMLFLHQELSTKPAALRKWKATLDNYETALRDTKPGSEHDTSSLIYYSSALQYYLRLGNFAQTEAILQKAEPIYAKTNSPLYKIVFDQSRSSYYGKTQQYEQALACLRAATRLMKEISTGTDYHNMLLEQAYLLHKLKRYNEALEIYKLSRTFNDSLQVATIQKQYEQLRKNFNADQRTLQQAKTRHILQLSMLILLGIGVLIVALLVIYLLRSNRFLKKAETEMRAMSSQVEHANRVKERFLSNISNTIQTPLNTVVDGSLRLAEQTITDPEERAQLSTSIRIMSTNLLTVINDILDLSRLEAGMMKLNISETEISVLILDAIGATASENNNIDIRYECPEGTQFIARLDGGRMLQLLTSLLAATTTGCKGITVTIAAKAEQLDLTVAGSALATPNPVQQIVIRNEINRMFLNRFGGRYELRTDQKPPVIIISLPATKIIRPE